MVHQDAFLQPQATVLSTVTDPSKCLAEVNTCSLSRFSFLSQRPSDPELIKSLDQLSHINSNLAIKACSAEFGIGIV